MVHVNGVDVSDWSGTPDWKSVQSAGYSFAYCKATEGIGNTQTSFDANASGVERAGMLFGAYHMLRFDQDPKAQAEHFLSVYQPKAGDLPPMLDLELQTIDVQNSVRSVSEWLQAVEPHLKGAKCVLYTDFFFWQDQLGATLDFAGHPLCIARYVPDPGAGLDLKPERWPVSFWQYAENKSIPGCDDADLDWFLGDIHSLRAMCIV
jgi:lysozyme